MEIERFVRITLTEEVANAIIAEIGTLEDKFDKEYIGSPYDEIKHLQILKRTLRGE